MNSDPSHPDYNLPSRLLYFPGCNTPISGMLWDRHLATLRTLQAQADHLGLWQVSFELSLLIADHVAEQLKAEGQS